MLYGIIVCCLIFLSIALCCFQISLSIEYQSELNDKINKLINNKTFSKSEIQEVLLTFLRVYYPTVFVCCVLIFCGIIQGIIWII